MRLFKLAFSAACAMSAAAASAEAGNRSVAGDVVDLSTRICFGIASGAVAYRPRDVGEEMAAIRALGLNYGIPSGIIDTLGQAGRNLVSRATIASRPNGDYQVILAAGGAMPGCHVLLAGRPDAALAEAVSEALADRQGGWTRVPSMTDGRGPVERRSFIRRDSAGRPYLLDLFIARGTPTRLGLIASVTLWPRSVALPRGY